MTAPAIFQSGQPGAMPRPRRGGGQYQMGQPGAMPLSSGSDGGMAANGLSTMPGQGQLGQPGQTGQPHRQWQTSHPPAPQSGAMQGSAPPPTFAQMQSNGQARPAPPPQYQPQYQGQGQSQFPSQPSTTSGASSFSGQSATQPNGVSSSLATAVQQALANPSAYGSQQVMDTYNMLNQQLSQGYDYQRKQLNDEMASRGLSESTIAGQRYSDLATEQARAQGNMATQLATQAAQTYGQDRNSAIQSGIGLGNLDLTQQLGLGNLGVAQQNAGTSAQSVSNQYSLGQGQLGVSQQAQDLARQLGLGNLNLQQQQLGQQGSQFQQSLGLDQLKNAQQYGLQQADLTGAYNGQQTLAAKAQTTAQQQFQQQLQQALGIATMQDKTSNRGIDIQGQNQLNSLLMQMAMLGIGGGNLAGLTGGAGAVSGGTGTAGGTTGTGGSGGASLTKIPSSMERTNPQLYAMSVLSSTDPNALAYLNDPNNTVSFGGKQYSTHDYYMLMAQHPELFATQQGGVVADGPQQGGGELVANQTQSTPSWADPAGAGKGTFGQWSDAPAIQSFDDYLAYVKQNGGDTSQIDTPANRLTWSVNAGTPGARDQAQAQADTAHAQQQATSARYAAARQDLIDQGADPDQITVEALNQYLAQRAR